MMISSPTAILFGFLIVFLFAVSSSSSVTPNLLAILDSVSPFLIV